MQKFKNTLLKSEPIDQRRNKNLKGTLKQIKKKKRKHNISKHMGCSKNSSKREVYSDKHLC